MLHFDADALRARLPWPALVRALREMFAAGCEVPARHAHAVGDVGTVLLMPAWREGRHFGLKTVAIFPGNRERGMPALHASYVLFDASTGVPRATMDGSELTARRTAAASALAADYLARADARHLVLVGAGRVASLLPGAMRSVRPGLEGVTVWNRHGPAAAELARRLCEQGFASQATADLEGAVRRADIVSCATLATSPLVQGDWLAPGAHLDLVGGFTPAMREADGRCLARARVYVDTDEALAKSGDLLQAIAEGHFDATRVQATLAGLCRGEHAGRGRADEITLFKSVGTALEDLSAAEAALAGLDNAAIFP